MVVCALALLAVQAALTDTPSQRRDARQQHHEQRLHKQQWNSPEMAALAVQNRQRKRELRRAETILGPQLHSCNKSSPHVVPKWQQRQHLCGRKEIRAAFGIKAGAVPDTNKVAEQRMPILMSRELMHSQKMFMNEKPFAMSKFEPFFAQLPGMPNTSDLSAAGGPACNPCDTCAVVGASGSLLRWKHGALIDAHEVVMRPNWVTTIGYEQHVGTRTTFNLFFGVEGMISQFEARAPVGAVGLVTSGSDRSVASAFRHLNRECCRLRKACCCGKNEAPPCKRWSATLPNKNATNPRVLLMSDATYHSAFAHICAATKDGCEWQRRAGIIRPSTGFLAVVLALHACRKVSLFGLQDDPCMPFKYYSEPRAKCGAEIPKQYDEPLHWFEREHALYNQWQREGLLQVFS
jgi:hypothetical protein